MRLRFRSYEFSADSIAWLLNLRGADIPRNPVVHAFALVEAATGGVRLFADAAKFAAVDPGVPILPPEAVVHLTVASLELAAAALDLTAAA